MDKEIEFIIKALKNIKLKEDEKVMMRTHLLQKLTLPETQDVTNSGVSRLSYYYQNIKNNYFMINKNRFVPAFIVALIVVLTGGTSVFAEKAVPGDLLYGIKVSVNEPVAGVFALSKEEKTEWKERLVERRLEEAQKLVSDDKLDESTRISLENKIKVQVDEFNASVGELALEKDGSIDSSDLNIRLQASLRAYQNVLEKISGETDTSTDTKRETEKLVSSLKESKNKVKDDHEDLELNVGVDAQNVLSTSTTTASFSANSASVFGKQTAAESVLKAAKLFYQKEKINLSTNIQNQIDNKFALAELSLQEGIAFSTSSDYANAIDKFQLVINTANTAKLLMLSNVIKGDIEDDMDGDVDSEDIEDDDDIEEIEEDNDIEDDDIEEDDENENSSNQGFIDIDSSFDDSEDGD